MLNSTYAVLKFFKLVGGEIVGRKRLQKTVYIMQYMNIPLIQQEFNYYHYGPYSEGLSISISRLVASELLKETCNRQVYTYNITKEGKAVLNLLESKSLVKKYEADTRVKKLAKFVKNQDPQLLEFISTVMFLRDYGEDRKDAFNDALKLKPHLHKYEKDAKKIIDKIFAIQRQAPALCSRSRRTAGGSTPFARLRTKRPVIR